MNESELNFFLEHYYKKYKFKFSSKDPVWILHKFQDEKDIELIGLITSCYAYGRVDQINQFIQKFLSRIHNNVYEFTLNFNKQKDKKYLQDLFYRFNSDIDLIALVESIKINLIKYESLSKLFLEKYNTLESNLLNPLLFFVKSLHNVKTIKGPYFNFLLPDPNKRSTCKRLNLFLRWMIRKDEIDLGIWSDYIDKSKLIFPVDTHVYRIVRKLKIIPNKVCDINFAISLTEKLKKFDRTDPVKYDFALCHIGIDKIF